MHIVKTTIIEKRDYSLAHAKRWFSQDLNDFIEVMQTQGYKVEVEGFKIEHENGSWLVCALVLAGK